MRRAGVFKRKNIENTIYDILKSKSIYPSAMAKARADGSVSVNLACT